MTRTALLALAALTLATPAHARSAPRAKASTSRAAPAKPAADASPQPPQKDAAEDAFARGSDKPLAATAASPTPSSGFDFDLLPPASHAAAASGPSLELERSVEKRRTMLTLHQAAGLTSLVLLAGTVFVGAMSYRDRLSGGDTGKYEVPHKILAYSTEASFFGTGALALFAPEPYDKPALTGFDSATVHKVSMAGASLFMASEIGLGLYTASREGLVDYRQMAGLHLAAGATALALMTLGATAFVF